MIVGTLAILVKTVLSRGQLFILFRVFCQLGQYLPQLEVVYIFIRVVPKVLERSSGKKDRMSVRHLSKWRVSSIICHTQQTRGRVFRGC